MSGIVVQYWLDSKGAGYLQRAGGRGLEPVPDALRERCRGLASDASASANGRDDYRIWSCGQPYRVSVMRSQTGVGYALRPMQPLRALDEIGLAAPLLTGLRGLCQGKGLIVVSGGTGDGKTTTAGALFADAVRAQAWAGFTLEDPPEIDLEGEYRIEGRPEVGRIWQQEVLQDGWGDGIKRLLRYQPDAILVGECRDDSRAAREAISAALNGHLVVTTVHADGAVATVERLLMLARGVDWPIDRIGQSLASGLRAVLHQTFGGTGLVTQPLFVSDRAAGKIREGRIPHLAEDVEQQQHRVWAGREPLEDWR